MTEHIVIEVSACHYYKKNIDSKCLYMKLLLGDLFFQFLLLIIN